MDNLPNVHASAQERIQRTTRDTSSIEVTDYQCEVCALVFPRLHSLRVHLRDIHKENAFPCETCGEKLASRSLLKFHMKSHKITGKVMTDRSSFGQSKQSKLCSGKMIKFVKGKSAKLTSSEQDSLQNHSNDSLANESVVRDACQRMQEDCLNRPSVLTDSEAESAADVPGEGLVMVIKQERRNDDLCSGVSSDVASISEMEVVIDLASFPHPSDTGNITDTIETDMSEIVKVEVPKMELMDEGESCIPTLRQEPEISEAECHFNKETPLNPDMENAVINLLQCSLCHKTFSDEISLVTHESLHDAFEHTPSNDEQTDIDNSSGGEHDPPEDENDYLSKLKGSGEFTCDKCPQSFPRQHLLKVHTFKVHGENAFPCQICGEMCPTRKALTKHKQVHVVDGSFKCETCGFSQVKYSNFLRHLKLHSGTRDYTCEWCGQSFTTSTVLIRHRRRHTGEKPYSCGECGERFARLYGLKVHESKHFGRNYKCTEENCSKAFYSKSALNNHLKSHLSERPYKCVACGCGFYMSSHYKDHIKRHTGEKPFVCDVCGKPFSRKSGLVMHFRVHTGEKPYICSHCDKAFNHKSALRLHLHSHTRSKEHDCSECDRTFKSKGALKRHIRCSHPKDDSDLGCDSFPLYLSEENEDEENSPENILDAYDAKSEVNDKSETADRQSLL